jgi:hypothetical protein
MAVLRDFPAGNVVVIRAGALGAARAAPMPWRMRAPINRPSFGASPPSREERVKTPMPA